MEEQNTEVLFECWGYKYCGTERKLAFKFSSNWKKKYIIVERTNHLCQIFCFDKKTKHSKDSQKGFKLYPEYKVQKLFNFKDKPFVCEVTNQDGVLCMAFDDEKLFHLMTFFTQAQTQLREENEGECFVVRPDNSEAQRKIGARGNMCLLHISQWGIILALQICKCIIGQWPLKALKWYESSAKQQFGFEAGRKSPMGGGIYVFNTRPEQDNIIYDKLDSHVMEAAGFRQMINSSSDNLDNVSMDSQLSSLQSLVTVHSDPRFTSTLKRISRNIYDQLSQHLGISSPTRSIGMSSSNLDLLQNGNNGSFGRSISSPNVQPFSSVENMLHEREAPPVVRPKVSDKIRKNTLGPVPKGRTYANDFVARESNTARKMKQDKFSSSYLSMNAKGSRDQLNDSSLNDSFVSDATWPRQHSVDSAEREFPNESYDPKSFYSLQRQVRSSPKNIPVSSPRNIPVNQNNQQQSLNRLNSNSSSKGSYLLAQRVSDPQEHPSNRVLNNSVPGHHTNSVKHDAYSPDNSEIGEAMEINKNTISNDYTNENMYQERSKFRRSRIMSRSMEDFSEYERMSQEEVEIMNYYQNEGFRMSDEVSPKFLKPGSSSPSKSPGFYSYASPAQLIKLAPVPGQKGYNYIKDSSVVNPTARGNQIENGQLFQKTSTSPNTAYPDVYQNDTSLQSDIYRKSILKGNSLQKSHSIPNLTKISDDLCDEHELQVLKAPFSKKKSVKIIPEPDQLAFANNMFKDEIQARNNNHKAEKNSGKPPVAQKPDILQKKPGLVLSMFKRQASAESASSNTSGIRSMSESPVSPPSGSKTPNSGVKGISFTPKTKSFKKPQPAEFSTADDTVSGGTPPSAKVQLFPSDRDSQNSTSSILRRQTSGTSQDHKMEGRRLPSLPPDAILSDNPVKNSQYPTKYKKISETLC